MVDDFIAAFGTLIDLLLMPFKWALDGLILVIGEAILSLLQGVFDCIVAVLTLVDISSIVQNFIMNMTGMPSQMIFLVNAVNLPAAITAILTAYGIRFGINLIPVVRI